MIRPGASEGLSNAHYAAMGNYILMPQAAGMQHALTPQTLTAATATGNTHLQAVQANSQQMPAVTSHQMNQQTTAGYRQQQFQYPLHSVGAQQLIVPQMQQFQMQQFPLLQSE